MTTYQNPIPSPAAPTTPRTALAQALDLHALADALGPSLSRRCADREAPAELGYGCVDWFIYGSETRVAPATFTG